MKRKNNFYCNKLNYVYSTGILYAEYKDFYFFPVVTDIFNTSTWLKKELAIFENKQLLRFKGKFSKKN